jgi:hypothetical protein
MSNAWYATLAPGDEVKWNDPDNGVCSGFFLVEEALTFDDGSPITPYTIVKLTGGGGV